MFLRIFLFLLSSTLIFGCKKPENRQCWKSNGEKNEISKSLLDSINKVICFDEIDIELIYEENRNDIVIEGPKNLLNFIETSFNNKELTIKNNNKCNIIRKNYSNIKVKIYHENITELINYGSGNLNINHNKNAFKYTGTPKSSGIINFNLKDSDLRVEINGRETVNEINILGAVNDLSVYNDGYGKFDTRNGKIQNIYIVNHNTQHTYLKAINSIEGVNYGAGNIYFNKEVINNKLRRVGSGKLISY